MNIGIARLILAFLFFYSLFSVFIINKMLKINNPFWNAIKSSISGAIIMLGVNLLWPFTGIYLKLNLINIAVSVIAGIPGICALLICSIVFL